MTFKIRDIIWDVGHFFSLLIMSHVRVGLHRPGWLYVLGMLPERTWHFQPPEHVPRTSAGAQTCVWRPGGLPVCHGAESTRKDPRPEKKKMPRGEKTHLYTPEYMYKVPLWDVRWSEIPGVTQVENGHAGSTAVATAYFCWVKHGNRSSRSGVPTDYYYLYLPVSYTHLTLPTKA